MKFSNLDKVFWEEEKITKGNLIEYYATIARYILPYLKDRPLVLNRFPNGIDKPSFYQKEAGAGPHPSFLKIVPIFHRQKKVNYMMVQNAKSLLYIANLGSIEMHPFNSRFNHIENPDYLVMDLDPTSIAFSYVVETALALHEVLEEIGIPSYPKTSGGKGLHVYIPLGAKYTYDQCRDFADLLAAIVHGRIPTITSLERVPKKRQKKVYLDTLQNLKGQTLAAAYSVRARPHATVSTPLEWKEIKRGLDPQDFTLKTVPARLKKKGDIFKKILGKGINLLSCLKKLEKLS